MKKALIDFCVVENRRISSSYSLLVLKAINCAGSIDFSQIRPGQFVEVKIDNSAITFLRRPISINDVVAEDKIITLLVRKAGAGTDALCNMPEGECVNVMLPLGNGFSVKSDVTRPLLIGGGVGVAPLLYLGKCMLANGVKPTFLLAAKTAGDLLMLDEFEKVGDVVLSTDNGSAGHKGLVTENPALDEVWDVIYCCGPMPMMKAIAAIAKKRGIECEVSLENTMACGLGACLCCVEDTVAGHVCVCQDGPVFNIRALKW